MGLIILAAWVATFAIGGIIQAAGYFASPEEISGIMAIGGVVLAFLGGSTFFALVKKKPWAFYSFVVLGVFSIGQFLWLEIFPKETIGGGDWFRLVAACTIYTLVAGYVYYKTMRKPALSDEAELKS